MKQLSPELVFKTVETNMRQYSELTGFPHPNHLTPATIGKYSELFTAMLALSIAIQEMVIEENSK